MLGGAKALEQHLKIHTNSRDFQCRLCGKSFVNQSRLTFHIGNVHEEPKFHCDQCSKTFRSKANFERHQRIHTDEKPYVCRFCGFRCNHATNLNSHVRTIHKDATFTTGKAAKEAKRKNLLKEILSEKDGREGGGRGGDTYVGEATSLPVSLGRDVLKRLECQGKIVTGGGTPPPPRRPRQESSVRPQKRLPQHEKSLIRNRQSREQIFTVTNSHGDLVEALVTLEALDEDLAYS